MFTICSINVPLTGRNILFHVSSFSKLAFGYYVFCEKTNQHPELNIKRWQKVSWEFTSTRQCHLGIMGTYENSYNCVNSTIWLLSSIQYNDEEFPGTVGVQQLWAQNLCGKMWKMSQGHFEKTRHPLFNQSPFWGEVPKALGQVLLIDLLWLSRLYLPAPLEVWAHGTACFLGLLLARFRLKDERRPCKQQQLQKS